MREDTGSGAPVTVLVEPDPNGHRFQAVANVAGVAGQSDGVVLLTSVGATATGSFATFLGGSESRSRNASTRSTPRPATSLRRWLGSVANVTSARSLSWMPIRPSNAGGTSPHRS